MIRFCPKDGGSYQQVEWEDADGNSYPNEPLAQLADKKAQGLAFTFNDVMVRLMADSCAIYNDRKATRALLNGLVGDILQQGTSHVSQMEFVVGIAQRLDLLGEGLKNIPAMLNLPFAQIAEAFGIKFTGILSEEKTAKFEAGIAKVKMLVNMGMNVASLSNVVRDLGVVFLNGYIQGAIIHSEMQGLSDDEAIEAGLVVVQARGINFNAILFALYEICTWAKNERPSPEPALAA